jgi:lipoprotein-anchoring transpeptidase ErfK/SrfK
MAELRHRGGWGRALVAIAVVGALHAVAPAVAAARCEGPGAPTRSSAWRAYAPAFASVLPGARAPASSARRIEGGGWLLVVGATRIQHGACMVQVRLDSRPNNARGWLARSRVVLARMPWRIEISRAQRRATLRYAGRAAARWRVVVGTPWTPTPAGLFAVQDSFRSPPASFAGAWIVTLTAHSQALATYDGGDGRVALHGRGGASLLDPLGSAASHGCIRFDNKAIGEIVRRVGRDRLPGVPVHIT